MPEDSRPGGGGAVAMGPVINAMFPRQKKEQTNSATKSGSTDAPVRANHQTAIVAPTKPSIASGLLPNRSDKPGHPNCPRKPPKPMADVTTPISAGLSFSTLTRYTGTIALRTNTPDMAQSSASMQTRMLGTRRTLAQLAVVSVAPISLPACVSFGSRNTTNSRRPITKPGIATIQNTQRQEGTTVSSCVAINGPSASPNSANPLCCRP